MHVCNITACNHINILHLTVSLHVPICLNKEGLLVPLKGTKLNCNLVLGFSLAFLWLKPALILTQTNTINLTHVKDHIFRVIKHHISPFFQGIHRSFRKPTENQIIRGGSNTSAYGCSDIVDFWKSTEMFRNLIKENFN